jgi:hypothetical protein
MVNRKKENYGQQQGLRIKLRSTTGNKEMCKITSPDVCTPLWSSTKATFQHTPMHQTAKVGAYPRKEL